MFRQRLSIGVWMAKSRLRIFGRLLPRHAVLALNCARRVLEREIRREWLPWMQ
ncbi:hypothetical protein CBM2614_A10042 [Cupriavidus taiwanensis]|uniref:Uncharacterized protein n=1 Tax=Cupriavidus taiwanensis TaxID=164546 RepID=A0A976G004_9BURK|nr:hypothetical protein CBM2614_A10042 [Cupriavidus taiwanensis]SOZ51602.1 hypothetical protein CBM2613_A10042 [Cupriavidus taiwanensis]